MEDLMIGIKAYSGKGIDLIVNFTYESVEDFSLLLALQELEIKIISSPVIFAGRRKNTTKNDRVLLAIDSLENCPNLLDKSNKKERIFYFPNQGLTPCYGPLVLDKMLPSDMLFSQLDEDYETNKLRMSLLDNDLFKSINTKNKRDKLGSNFSFSTTCEKCAFIKGRDNMNNIPSIEELFAQKERSIYYKTSSNLSLEQALFLNQKFEISYLYVVNQAKIDKISTKGIMPESISHQIIMEFNEQQIINDIDFIVLNYYARYNQYYNQKDIECFKKEYIDYIKSYSPVSKTYKKNDKIASMILINKYDENSVTEEGCIHIGYWGCDYSLISKEEMQAIRADWLSFIREQNNESTIIDTIVDFHNEDEIRWIEEIGFTQTKLRLKKRPI